MAVDVSRAIARPARKAVAQKKWNVYHFGMCVSFDTQAAAEAHLWNELDGEGYIAFGYPLRWH